MSKKILSKIVLLITIFIVIGANFKNRSLEKLNEGYSEIIITKIRSDENIFSGRIFYPSYIEEIRENDILDIIKFNSSLNYLISDNSLYENFVSQLTNELAMSFKIYKIDRRKTITKIFISGDKNKLEAKYNLTLENYKKNLYERISSRISNRTQKNFSFENLLVVNMQINGIYHKTYIFIFSSIFLLALSFFVIRELTKFYRNK